MIPVFTSDPAGAGCRKPLRDHGVGFAQRDDFICVKQPYYSGHAGILCHYGWVDGLANGLAPQEVLGGILILVGCIVRSTCRSMRDAFDSCNERLVLGGASPPPTVPSVAAAGPSGLSAEQRDRELQRLLPALLRRTTGKVTLCVQPWVLDIWCMCRLVHLPTHLLRQLHVTTYTASTSTKLRELALIPLEQKPADLSQLMGFCSALRSLPLRHCCEAPGGPGLPALLSTLHSTVLEQLSISNSSWLRSLSCLTHLVGLRELELGSHTEGESLGLTDLSPLTACSGLQRLGLAAAPLLSLASASALTSLTRLSFNTSDSGGCSLAPLTSLTGLRCLTVRLRSPLDHPLHGNPPPEERLFLAPLPAIKELILVNCDLLDLTPLTACPALQLLFLLSCKLPASRGEGGISALCRCAQLAGLGGCFIRGVDGEELVQVRGVLSAKGVCVHLHCINS